MDFGKLTSVDQVNFALQEEPRQNRAVLGSIHQKGNKTIYLGPTGYNMKPWVGKWYPTGAKDKDYLKHFGVQFNTIEMNTTHYRIPDVATVTHWYQMVPDDFRFCPKIPQSISHAPDLGLNGREIELFCEAIGGLAEKMGACFMQLPPYFSPKDLPKMLLFLDRWPAAIPLAIEWRHPSFFEANEASEHVFQVLEERNISTVITDVSGRRDVCHLRITASPVLIRFVGNDLHQSDYDRIRDWANRMALWFEQGLEQVYFFTHEPDNLLAPELTAFCLETFREAMPQVQIRGPKEVGGRQGSLFD